MKNKDHIGRLTKQQLLEATARESSRFEEFYLWLDKHMSTSFFEEIEAPKLILITHHLMNLPEQDFFTQIHFKHGAIVICLDAPDADITILKHFHLYDIKSYQTFLSDAPPPFEAVDQKLRIAFVYFSSFIDTAPPVSLPSDKLASLYEQIKEKNPSITYQQFEQALQGIDQRFFRSLNTERLMRAIDLYHRALTRDYCQYEIMYNEDYKEKVNESPSLQIVLSWKNPPKHRFLYRVLKMVYRHNMAMKRINMALIPLHDSEDNSIMIMSLGLHGMNDEPAWEACDLSDFLQELVTLKYFDDQDLIESTFVQTKILTGNEANLLRSMIYFIHQLLLHADPNLYSLAHIEEGLCRHPDLIVKLCKAFAYRFHPVLVQKNTYEKERNELLNLIGSLDTGHPVNDTRRRNILFQAVYFVDYTLKTNYYRNNKSALAFRLDPMILEKLPYERKERFPEIPYAIFFVKGMSFMAFHIRFKDLARGGIRTVIPSKIEQMIVDRNNVFSECYNLAYTQQKKNKDIPEGGAKGVIFLNLFEQLESEAKIYSHDLTLQSVDPAIIRQRVEQFRSKQRSIYLYHCQRSFVHSILTLVNCHDDGSLKAKDVISYYHLPEYLYFGPDENMHNVMIEWIAEYSKFVEYKPGSAFISSKPRAGINHKEYGVTSFGVNVYMHEALKFIGIDPETMPFTVKITGGPDGDVAGNQMLNLYKYYPHTAKLIAVTDISGTINDPSGLDLEEIVKLFKEGKPIRHYPPEKLSDGGFLLDMFTKREESSYTQQTLCYRKLKGELVQEWLSGSEMNHIFRYNVHQTVTDVFIPGGGRPRTLNASNYKEFLTPEGTPTSKIIIEAANLYLTAEARYALEEKGALIIKDSSANKGGVICSSCEVQIGLVLSDEEFIAQKPELMKDVLGFIYDKAYLEAQLMLRTRKETNLSMIDISDKISEKINSYTYEILDYLTPLTLSKDPQDPNVRCLLKYSLPKLSKEYQNRILDLIPESHKKAMIACYIASQLVYTKGTSWSPRLIDVLPLVIRSLIG